MPDLVQKVLKGQDPLHILGDGEQVRHYTYGGDLARGIRLCVEHPAALNEDFNLSTQTSTTVLELAELIWRKVHGDWKPFRVISDKPFPYDVRCRIPSVEKARDAARLRGHHDPRRDSRRGDPLGRQAGGSGGDLMTTLAQATPTATRSATSNRWR